MGCKGKNKGSPQQVKTPKIKYEGAITLNPPPGDLAYYPPAVPIMGKWTSKPINAKNTVSLCDCDGNDITDSWVGGGLSVELGDKEEGPVTFLTMKYIPCATVTLKNEAGEIYASSTEIVVGVSD